MFAWVEKMSILRRWKRTWDGRCDGQDGDGGKKEGGEGLHCVLFAVW